MINVKVLTPVFTTILLTVYAQLIIKWQAIKAGSLPQGLLDKTCYIGKILTNPWVISGFIAVFLGSICWLIAMTKLQLNYIYPFIGLTIVIVMFASTIFFNESITLLQIIGTGFVIAGLILIGYSY